MAKAPISTQLEDNVPETFRPLAVQWNAALSSTLDFMFSEDGGMNASPEEMHILFDIVLQCAAGIFAPAGYDRKGRKQVEKRFAACLQQVTEQFTEDFDAALGKGETRQ